MLTCDIEQRLDFILPQAVTALVTSFARKIRLVQRYMPPKEARRLLDQYASIGYLVGVQGTHNVASVTLVLLTAVPVCLSSPLKAY